MRLPEPLRYTAQYARHGTSWEAKCPALGLVLNAPTLQQARDVLLAAVRDQARKLGPPELPPPDEPADEIYVEQFAVQPFFLRQVFVNPVGGTMEPTGPYVQADGELQLRDSVVVVLDELGTSNGWLNAFTVDDLRVRSRRLESARDWLTSKTSADIESVVAYTDNVLYAVPTDADLIWTIFITAISAGRYQLNMTLGGTLVRGAMARGPHHSSAGLVAGPAVVRAHELEATPGGPPRIILAAEVEQTARLAFSSGSSFVEPEVLARVLLEDTEGRLFVDYLGATTALEVDRAEAPHDLLEQHRDALAKGLERYGENPKYGRKWRWAAGIHNFVVNESEAPSRLLLRSPTAEVRRAGS